MRSEALKEIRNERQICFARRHSSISGLSTWITRWWWRWRG